ncbi:MAG: class I SAM-dependent methyltransferase [Desulfobacterales bacterium]|nr:MAG: class I SAM-dependent methyltransferase [Desulfobacterales bacterium]
MTLTNHQSPIDANSENAQQWRTVVTCYSAVDRFFPACGLFDLTEGIYHGNPKTPYEQAEANQLDYLLDQIRCEPGCRVLDLGCGYGTLLERIRQRGAIGIGNTISPEQLKYCREKNLDVFLIDYRAIPGEWERTFDGVIANGSIEHFVQPTDAAAGKQDDIYRHLFAKVHRQIDPNSNMRRFATTTVHFVRKPSNPLDVFKNPLTFRWGSDNFHWAVLERGWGGYYPEIGQLRRCADGYFDLIDEDDGTEDYRFTSAEWLRRTRRALLSLKVVKIAYRSLPVLVRSPGQFMTLLLNLLSSESWNWQFRPPNPPTRLLRQTWAYLDRH